MSLLVISEILGLFVNTLGADDKYSFCNSDNFLQPIQMQLLQKHKTSWLSAKFLQLTLSFDHLRQKMTLIANVF